MAEEQKRNNAFQNEAVLGRNAVAELLKSDAAVDTLLLAEGLDEGTVRYYTALAKQAGAVVKRTRKEKLNAQYGTKHQGVAALAAQVAYVELDSLLEVAREKGEPPFLLLADGIEDPHNLGALIRTALLCGVHGVVIAKRGAVGVTPVVMKASAGAAAHMPVARVANLGEAVRRLKKQGVFVWCAHMEGTPLEQQDVDGPFALVVGAEGKGVSPLVQKLCDGAICLDMAQGTGIGSYNVSVAGGIILYHAFRRRCAAAEG